MNENSDLKKIEKKLFEKITEIRYFDYFFSKRFTKRLYNLVLSVPLIYAV